jgi:hypothetical protein
MRRSLLHYLGAPVCFALLAVTCVACTNGDSGATDATTPPNTGGDTIDESVLAKCPQASTLIQTTEWTRCLEGKRLAGAEPFSNTPCELRIGANGAIDYLRNGVVAIAVPELRLWRSGSGNYQNDASSGSRIFIAGIAPDIVPEEGKPRVTDVDISLFALSTQQDVVSVRYLDSALARQTYNCNVKAL